MSDTLKEKGGKTQNFIDNILFMVYLSFKKCTKEVISVEYVGTHEKAPY